MSIFKTEWTKADMQSADDPQFAPAVTQVPTDDPKTTVPSIWWKSGWPQDVVNVRRPRFGRDQ